MELGISGKFGLVTGCSRGIGRGIAEALAHEGVRLVLVARSADALRNLQKRLPNPDSHFTVPINLMEPNAPERLAKAVNEIGPLDILVNNLGGSAGVRDSFAPAEEWAKVWQFNLGININLNRAFIPGMVERRQGRIIHITTLSTSTYQGAAAYVSAKCALEGYIKTMSREVSMHNVILSGVAPGAISLEGRYFQQLENGDSQDLDNYYNAHLPIRRFGQANDVASAVCFLCSDHASYLAGAIIPVDGGWK